MPYASAASVSDRSVHRPAVRCHDDPDRQIELPGELEIALVVRGHGHDRARAVLAQHEIGDPDRHRFTREWVDGTSPCVESLLLDRATHPCCAVLRSECLHLLAERGRVWRRLRKDADERMLGGEQHERCAVDRVDAGGEDFNTPGARARDSRLWARAET